MQDLQQIAASERMIPGAPVHASKTIVIDAPIDRVWRIQTDVDHWQDWYSYLRDAKLIGQFAPGTKLNYGWLFKHRLVIAKVREFELAMVYGKYVGFSAVTKWDFKPLAKTQTQVTFSESSVGFLMAVVYSSVKLAEHLDGWLQKLKARAERS